MRFEGFDDRFFGFFHGLSANNNREWFQEHKHLYEEGVVAPLLAFIEAMGPKLAAISPQFLAIPRKTGGSMFRIYRDTRFSKNKTPYKTHAAAQFRHQLGKDVHAPGFYVHADPTDVFCGLGIWHPESGALAKIRKRIDGHGKEWLQARDHPPFTEKFYLAGDSLKRAPKGYPADHPLLDDLKRKDFMALRKYPSEMLRSPDLVDVLGEDFKAGTPLLQFLCRALEVPF